MSRKSDRIEATRDLVAQWQQLRREGRCSLQSWICLKTMCGTVAARRRLEEAEVDVWLVSQEPQP